MHGLLASAGRENDPPRDVIVASVVPSLRVSAAAGPPADHGREPLFVEPGIKTGMPILYDAPQEVGADRIVNAVAAYERLGGPCVVVDFGTATTFDVVTAKGEYAGGVIVPGSRSRRRRSSSEAARLWRVEIRPPERVVGRRPRARSSPASTSDTSRSSTD